MKGKNILAKSVENEDNCKVFKSISSAAEYLNVYWSLIKNSIDNSKEISGYLLTSIDDEVYNSYIIEKCCSSCKVMKPLTSFSFKSKEKRRSICKICQSEKDKIRRETYETCLNTILYRAKRSAYKRLQKEVKLVCLILLVMILINYGKINKVYVIIPNYQ
jgi:hypothetical protein